MRYLTGHQFNKTLLRRLVLLCILGNTSSNPISAIESSHTTNVEPRVTTARQGWTSPINQRGTADIIWTCGFTLFLCSWSVLCLNLPAPGDSTIRKLWRKFYLTVLCLLGPEFIMQMALGQLVSARESIALFHDIGHDQWTLTHGFFANMGGFVLHTTIGPEHKSWEPFPVDSKQLHYLIKHNYIDSAAIKSFDKKKIRDRNKFDGLLRVLTMIQTSWFLVNLCARTGEDLAITTLELTTAAFIASSYATQIFWYYKPADIDVPEIIVTTTSGIDDILREAGDAARVPFSYTPLDFVSRKEWSWSKFWSIGRGFLRAVGLRFSDHGTPIKRISNTAVPEIKGLAHPGAWLIAWVYFAIFFAAWNWSFPSATDKWLWRICCLIAFVEVPLTYGLNIFSFHTYPWLRAQYWPKRVVVKAMSEETDQRHAVSTIGRLTKFWRAFGAYARNNSTMKDPELDMPMHAFIVATVLLVIYLTARAGIWVEDFLELRSLPSSAYRTVDWGRAIPFLGNF